MFALTILYRASGSILSGKLRHIITGVLGETSAKGLLNIV